MRIILRYILKSIRERKFRSFLILFAIALSTGLFFASNALSVTLQEMYVEVMRKYYGSSHIVIRPGPRSLWFLSPRRAESRAAQVSYVIGCIEGGGSFRPNREENVDIALRGFEIEDLFAFSPVILAAEGALRPFDGNKIIVSRISADAYGWKLGDSIDIEVQGAKRRFLLVGIALSTGVFKDGFDRNLTAVVPRDYLASLYDIRGKATTLFVRAKDAGEVPALIEALSKDYPRFIVREPVDKAEQERFMSEIKTPLLLMTIMVLFVSVFIIYSSFKVITVERLPIIGTFRSIGATRKTTDFVLILETFLYGVVGGLIGCALGIGILWIMTNLMSYNAWAGLHMKIELHFQPLHMIAAFLLAVVLSFGSSLVPIVRISRIPVKDIVLGKSERRAGRKAPRLIAGIAALVVTPVVPLVVPKSVALPVDAVCLFLMSAAVVTLVPFLTALLVRVLQKVSVFVFGNTGVLASKNLRENRNVLNNISLLVLSLSSLILIFTISFSVITQIVGFYTDARFGVWLWAYRADRNMELVLRSVPGVQDTGFVYSARNIEVEEKKKSIGLLNGIDTRRYKDFWDVKVPPGELARLDEGRNILISSVLQEKLDARMGDLLTLQLKEGKKKYRVIGVFTSSRDGGNFALVAGKYLKADTGAQYYDDIYVKTTQPPQDTAAALKEKLRHRYPWVSTVAQMRENDLKSNQQFMTLLQGFAVMTLVIGIFGVLNNFIISFVERRRHIAIFRSVGMSRKQLIAMLLMESTLGGLIGGVVGCACGAIALFIASYLLRAMDTYVTMTISPPVFIACLAASIVVSLIASISPALRSGRLNIIESIKYE